MSPYADELAHARLEALRQLIDAMREAEDPAEKRRCAVAIFNAPDPCELDDEIELEDDDDNCDDNDNTDNHRAPSINERVESPSPSTSPITPHAPSSVPSVLSAPSPSPTSAIGHPTSDIPFLARAP